ncbi:MAG: ABC transporter ATP-binding protein [Bacillota bacterium]|jgi:ATP-binding cassette subfamily B protein
MKKKSLLIRIVAYMKWHKYLYVLSLLFSALSAVVNIGAFGYVYYVAREVVLIKGNIALLNAAQITDYGWKAVLYISISFGFYGLALAFSHIVAFNTVAEMRVRIVRHLRRLPLGYFQLHTSGELRKVIEKNTNELEHFIAHQIPDTVQTLVTPIAFIVFIFKFDWRLALVCFVPVLAGFALLKLMLGGESEAFLKTYQQASENMGKDVVEYIRGISVVKMFDQTVFSFKDFNQSIERYRDYMLKYSLSMRKYMSGYIASVYGVFVVLIPAGILLFNHTEAKASLILGYIFFVVITPMIAFMLMRIMDNSYKLMISVHSLDAIEERIFAAKFLPVCEQPKPMDGYDIAFKEVDFGYEEGAKVLDRVSFTAKEGSITALVGPSGGGKTSILNLIARFWDVDQGTVSVGGVNVRSIDYEQLTDCMSIVFQENDLFKLSIAENVAFSKKDATEKEILRALHEAQCDEIIAKLKDGIHTVIGAKGIHLSGGEIQRIALARAILKDAPIILLDEATAFADPENEYLIQKALAKLIQGKTVIMIAHRLSIVTDVDNILVINNGRIIEAGCHDVLIKNDGLYAKMYQEYQSSTSWKFGEVSYA